MRYISVYDRLKLYDYSGNIKYSFNNKELIIGLPTDTSAVIDASTQDPFEKTLMRIFPTSLTTGSNALLERCGLGYLDSPSNYRLFFEAPYLTAVTLTADGRYRVEKGQAVYNGVTYDAGEIIEGLSGGVITATSNSYFAQWLPSALDKIDCGGSWTPTEQFKINNLLTGTESNDYWTYSLGYSGKNSVDPDSPNYVGWIDSP